jgi:TolB-like protein
LDPVIISIPRGSYQPDFAARTGDEPRTPAGAGRVERRLQRMSLAGLVVLILAVVGWLVVAGPGSGADAVSIAVLPFSAYGAGDRAGELAARITDGVTTELAASTAMAVVSRTTASQFSDRMAIPAVARAVGADLVMEGGVVIDGAGIRVTARLVDGHTDRKVWVGQYEVAPDGIDALVRRIATEVAVALR